MRRICSILFMLSLNMFVIGVAFSADSTNGNCGIIYGDKHSFSICAPKGWILDNRSGVPQGLHAVFYPEGKTWQNSNVVMYVNWALIDDEIKNIKDLVQLNVDRFKINGSPNIYAKFIDKVKNERKQIGELWEFTGDKWGNYERLCYFQEKNGIALLILSSRNKDDFESSKKALIELAKSYFFVTEDVKY